MLPWDQMSALTQAGALAVAAVAFLAFFAMVALRFLRRGAARHWAAPGTTALILLPVVVGAGIATLCFRQWLGGMVLSGAGGVALLAAGSTEALFVLFVGLSLAAPLVWVGLISMSVSSSRSSEAAGSGGGLALPVMAFVAILLSSGLVLQVVRLVTAVNAGMRGQDLLLRLNLSLAGAALLAALLLGLTVATAIGAPRGASPPGVRVAALSAVSLCGLLVLGGFWGVYREIQSYMAAAIPYPSGEALPTPASPPPRPEPGALEGAGVVGAAGAIQEPRKLENVVPVYPEAAKKAGVEGTVVLEATVGPEGKVTDVRVVRGIPLLDQAAIDAVRQWVYTPTLLNGVPVPVIMTVTVNFKLTRQE